MSVAQTNVVDAIYTDTETGRAILTVINHLDWEDKEHFLTLQEKLNAYLRFVESGELLDSYPDAQGCDVLINVVCKYAPTDEAKSFLNKVKDVIEGAGIKFTYEVFILAE